MNAHYPDRFDRDTAEDLLRGRPVQGIDGRLSDLLGAAAAPGPDRELPGEQAALAAFRTAQHATSAQPKQGRVGRSPLRRHRSMKLITAAVAATITLAGTAAAVTGTLPIGFHGSPPSSGVPGQHPGTTTRPAQPTGSNDGSAASVQQLCQRYLDTSGGDRRNTLDDPAFGALVHAAGGKQNVSGYCARLSANDKPKRQPDTGSDTRHPDGPPSRQQNNQPP